MAHNLGEPVFKAVYAALYVLGVASPRDIIIHKWRSVKEEVRANDS